MSKFYNYMIQKKELIKKVLPIELLRKGKYAFIDYKAGQYKEGMRDKEVFASMPRGVNLVGDIRIEIGLGQSMRLLANALSLSKYPFGIVNSLFNTDVRRNDHSWDHKIRQYAPYGINLLHFNPPDLNEAYAREGDALWKNHYNIGFWLWELEDFPKQYLPTFKFVDEIWTPSEFASNCFRKLTDKPVYTIPYHVTAEADLTFDREYFGLPKDKFLYLIMFDFNSTMLRKNPVDAVEAFKNAFAPENQDVGLVIKVNNSTQECRDTLEALLKGYKNVYYITGTLDKSEVNSLIACADVYVSLHRAEGFGLILAEAMLLKTACIATNWSSNTEFMNSDCACMVSCNMVKINEGEGLYPPGAIWANPSVTEATEYMLRLKNDSSYYHSITENAYRHASTVLGKNRIVDMMERRISQIYELAGE